MLKKLLKNQNIDISFNILRAKQAQMLLQPQFAQLFKTILFILQVGYEVADNIAFFFVLIHEFFNLLAAVKDC